VTRSPRSDVALRRLPARAERLIERLPEAARADVRESLARIVSIRTPSQAFAAFSDEVEHLLRVLMPVFVRYPLVRTPAAGRRLAALSASTAAAVEEADELIAALTLGTAVAPGTGTLLAVGVAATVVEAYAAASVRVHQLRNLGYDVDVDAVALDVHAALFDVPQDRHRGRSAARWVARRGTARLARRWTAGLVPIVGIAYAGYDARRTVDRVLLRPLPLDAMTARESD
jgi:hypothetical protein